MLIPSNKQQLDILQPIMNWLFKEEVIPPITATGYKPVVDDPIEDLYNLTVPRTRAEIGLEAATAGPLIPATGLIRGLARTLDEFTVPLKRAAKGAKKEKKVVAGWNRPTTQSISVQNPPRARQLSTDADIIPDRPYTCLLYTSPSPRD